MKTSSRAFLVISGLLYIVVSYFLCIEPIANLIVYSWLISVAFLINSLAQVVTYFSVSKELRHVSFLLSAVLNVIIAGYFVSVGYIALPIVMPILLGIWLVVEGMFVFAKGLHLKEYVPAVGKVSLGFGIISLVFGILVLFNPMATIVAAVYIVAAGFFVDGIYRIIEAVKG